jgi:hypothetical protein
MSKRFSRKSRKSTRHLWKKKIFKSYCAAISKIYKFIQSINLSLWNFLCIHIQCFGSWNIMVYVKEQGQKISEIIFQDDKQLSNKGNP